MLRSIAVFVLVAGIVGCATSPARQEANAAAQQHLQDTQPVCAHPRQCEAMWIAARDWITSTCGFKIQVATDNLLETYNSTDASTALACRVTKTPLPAGGYKFAATAGCDNIFGCGIPPLRAVQSFNDKLNASGAAFKD